MAEEFYTSIGLFPMTETFWKESVIEQPKDGRQFSCHGTAYDMIIGDDYRPVTGSSY